MKDVVVVGPVLLAGGFALNGLSWASERGHDGEAGYLFFLAFLLVVLLAWYRAKVGSAERIRRLEIERDRPAPPPTPAPVADARSSAVGSLVGAPVGVAGVAWLTCLTTGCDPNFVWSMVGVLGVTSIACGTLLAARGSAPAAALPDESAAPASARFAFKPAHDPDAFDLVGRRG